ncbi:MAG TPA: RNA polymerase-binding protein DksA [Nitrospirae bacterium]|nr:RNA polymerase-binding transcription factor DksA [bacterium BMS3Bbin09]HDH34276.1 RNA polymerase-binding protein DksA [Nitrospirota bacterium]HDN95258.1 RNA polymerase-binding protein DksA [Nitrospirota bacterium]HDO66810.1 RNA polymerase-binding protein DksA [Nitrospirota bacterium]HEW80984.1 RNA polymerase-binding protein DksA [Nitrospirota bacterium]
MAKKAKAKVKAVKKKTTKAKAKKSVCKTSKKKCATAKKKTTVKKKTTTAKKKPATKKKPVVAAKKKTRAKKPLTLSRRAKVIHQVKQNLLSQRASLLKEAEETLSTLPGEINFPDMGDQATAETDRNFILRLRDRERMLLKKIEETIERIDSADYGICEECGNKIGLKRLEARPVTTYCIECKTRQEEEERIAEGAG